MLKVAGSVLSGALNFQGTWDALTNSPTLQSGIGVKGYYYVVSVAGNTNLDGITDWQLGDWAVFNGTVWQKVDNSEAVTSVNGQTGAVVLTANDVGATPNTTFVLASGLLSGGGQLNANVTVSLTSVPFANVTGAGSMASQNANAVSITGGSIDGTTIGGSTPANGTFVNLASTNVTVSNNVTLNSLTGYVYANNTSAATASTTIPVAAVTGAVPNTVNIIAGTGLSGGGALTGNVTLTNAGVTAFNTRTGSVTLSSSDVTTALGYTPGTGNGSVTSVSTGTGLTGGTITTTGTISIANTAVTAGTYGNASTVGSFTVNQQGQITSAANNTIAIDVTQVTNAVPTSRTVSAGTGLTGGGNLSADITLSQSPNTVQQLVQVQNNAVVTGTRQAINFLPGSNITFATSDDALGGRVNVNVSVSGLGSMAFQNSNDVNITGGNINSSAVNTVALVSNTVTFAVSSLPLIPEGYITINLNGVAKKIPYYGV